ncbi:MAG TPA: hypothetical protein VF364_09350 [Candidatus Limnocylindria bacterium]
MVLLVAMGTLAAARPAAAAEDATVVLPGSATAAVTVDLDGDGAREIVRLVQQANGADLTVDAWAHDGRGGWAQLGEQPMPVAAVDGDDPPPGGAGSALLRWHDDGRERLLAASAVVANSMTGATCCLTLFEVLPSARAGIEVRHLQQIGGGAQYLRTADLDADGSDELVLHESRFGEAEPDPVATLAVHRWNGSTFERMFETTDRELFNGVTVGQTDGVPGDDLLFGPIPDGRLHRLAWADGSMREEEAAIDLGGPPDGWIAGAADDAIILLRSGGISVMRWERGRPPSPATEISIELVGNVFAIGDGPDAVLGVQNGDPFGSDPSAMTTLYDLTGRRLGEIPSATGSDVFWRLFSGEAPPFGGNVSRNVFPYVGPMPDGLGDGVPAFIASGTLVQPGGPDGYEARSMASLIGMQPLGLAGPADGWAVVGDVFGPFGGGAYLSWGGIPPGWGRVATMPLADFLLADDKAAAASIGLRNAVEVARTGSDVTILADGDGFEVSVTAAPGSVVMFGIGSGFEEHEVEDEPIVLVAEPRRGAAEDENQEFEAILLVVGPGGRGIGEQWTGTFVREAPELSVSAETVPMALGATLDGVSSPGSVVSVDGAPIATDARGRFTTSVDAPIWPSQLVVSATDPLGNETTERVEVVGLVDYRGLPWAGILVVVLVGVGAVLYIRTPRRRAPVAVPDGDGRLEELELDAIDAADAARR